MAKIEIGPDQFVLPGPEYRSLLAMKGTLEKVLTDELSRARPSLMPELRREIENCLDADAIERAGRRR